MIIVLKPDTTKKQLDHLLERIKTLAPGKPFLWVCKGLEAGSGLLPHQVVAEVMGDVACGVLTGRFPPPG